MSDEVYRLNPEEDSVPLPPKKEKRIKDLIKSGGTAKILTIISFFTGPLGVLLVAVGWLYYWETGRLLTKFPGMQPSLAKDLTQARRRYFWMGTVTLIWWGAIMLIMLVIVISVEMELANARR